MKQIKSIEDLNNMIQRLINTKPIENAEYYQLGLFADESNKFKYSLWSNWVGYTEDNPQREIREPSFVIPEVTINLFKQLNRPVFVINSEDDLLFFIWVTGGESIIEKSIAEKHLQHILKPQINAYLYSKGFVDINSLPEYQFNRALNPKFRIKILNRDKRRCRICGASPANNEHVELHIHHIIPFGKGGLTDEKNLITLCHTCHKGLEPHTDYSLFDNIGVRMYEDGIINKEYNERIKHNILANEYRRKRLKNELHI